MVIDLERIVVVKPIRERVGGIEIRFGPLKIFGHESSNCILKPEQRVATAVRQALYFFVDPHGGSATTFIGED